MAIFKCLNAAGKYQDPNARENVIRYVTSPYKTPSHIIGGVEVNMYDPAASMDHVAAHFQKEDGVRLRHFVVSFFKNEIRSQQYPAEIAYRIAAEIGMQYQVVYALHEDSDMLHIHFVHNTINYVTGQRYRGNKTEYYNLKHMIRGILGAYGINRFYEVSYRPDQDNPNE